MSFSTTTRSTIFDKNGTFEMGLKCLNSASFDFFGIGVTITRLKDSGMYPVDSDQLTISVKIGSQGISSKRGVSGPELMIWLAKTL